MQNVFLLEKVTICFKLLNYKYLVTCRIIIQWHITTATYIEYTEHADIQANRNIKPTDINAKRTEIIIKLKTHINEQVAFWVAIWVVPDTQRICRYRY